ncbi:MAG: hypothetical protein LBB20_03025 [Puniceicoccales bacterium]|jgi:hypothetical protein|nr:hypothetical protein [Puniceicoccales bacterium]
MSFGSVGSGSIPDGIYVNGILVDPTAIPEVTTNVKKKKVSGDAQIGGQVLKIVGPEGVGITSAPGEVAGYYPTLTADPTFTTEDGKWAKVLQSFEQDTSMRIGNSAITANAEEYNAMLNGLDASSNIAPSSRTAASIGTLAAQVAILMTKNASLQKSIEREMKAEMTQLQYQIGMDVAQKIREKGELEFNQKMVEAFSGIVETAAGMIAQQIGRKISEHNLQKYDEGVAQIDTTAPTSTPSAKAAETRSEQAADENFNRDQFNAKQEIIDQKIQNEEIINKDAKTLSGPANLEQNQRMAIPLTEAEKQQVNMEASLAGDLGKAIAGFAMKTVSAHLGLQISNKEADIRGMEALNQLVGNIIQNTESSIRSADQATQAAMQLFQQICQTRHEAFQSVVR